MKRVLSIQDLSCLGKCSLTVALPVLSAMGCACSVLPTAVLSTHTGFPNPHVHSLTGDMMAAAAHWKSIGAKFDAITVGYLSDPQQAAEVGKILDLFDGTVILDPVMGDHGKLYSRITGDHIHAIKNLFSRADFLLPNVTEAACLTGLPYREKAEESYLRELAQGLLDLGVKTAIITGFSWDDGHTGFYGYDHTRQGFSYRAKRIDKRLHGTGDLFAAAFTGGLMAEKEPEAAATLAAGFVERVVAATEKATAFGAEFEKVLPWLICQM